MFDGDPPPLANRVLLYNFIFFDSCYPYKFSLILRINKAKISAIEASEDLEFYITGFLRTAYRPYAYRLKILNTAYQKGGFTLRHVHVAHAFNTCIIETVPFCQESTVSLRLKLRNGLQRIHICIFYQNINKNFLIKMLFVL